LRWKTIKFWSNTKLTSVQNDMWESHAFKAYVNLIAEVIENYPIQLGEKLCRLYSRPLPSEIVIQVKSYVINDIITQLGGSKFSMLYFHVSLSLSLSLYIYIYIYIVQKTIHKPNHPYGSKKGANLHLKMEKWVVETWIINMEMKIPILNIRRFLGI